MNDTYIGWLGARFTTCPCCGKETTVDEFEGITLTKDNLKYPQYFAHESKYHGCKEVGAKLFYVRLEEQLNILEKIKMNSLSNLDLEIAIFVFLDILVMENIMLS